MTPRRGAFAPLTPVPRDSSLRLRLQQMETVMNRVTLRALTLAAAFALAAGPAMAGGDTVKGKKVFAKCKVCHSLKKGKNKVGPSLYGVFGRKAGTALRFKGYSPAMKKSGVVWNGETLDKYLANPRGFIKGNRMPFGGLKKKADRDNLILYLEQATKPK